MEFVSPDPKALVRALNVRATLDAFQLRPSLGKSLIEKHDLELEDLKPDAFMPLQRWLDTLKEIQETVGANILHRVGAAVMEIGEFPPHLDSVDVVFGMMDAVYYMNHQGEVGHYHTSRGKDGVWEVRCETPYPRHMERGIVEGALRNPQVRDGRRYVVQYIDGAPDADVTCTMYLRPR